MIRRRTLRPPDMNPEGITAGEWVRKIRRKAAGYVERVTNDTAYVSWLDGTHEILPCVYLRRVPSGEGKDGHRPKE